MTFKYNNVYILDAVTITGPYEKKGPLGNFFDKSYKEFYFGTNSWEEAESKLIEESVNMLVNRVSTKPELLISGDLLNQIVASNYAASKLGIPYLGIYSACASSVEGLIIGANMIESNQIKTCICSASSHNNAAEKQFRYPVEYGGVKPKTTTFTTTGGCSAFLSTKKNNIKIESSTIGKVVDMGIKDVYNMGAVMAPACANTLYTHLIETKRDVNYYDLILSGDLGRYGKDIMKDYMKEEYKIELNNYDDSACMIYDINNQDVYAGASGPACLPLVTYSYIFNKMKNKEIKKVLLLATGALMSTTMVNEKETIPAITHAISLEVVE